MARSFLLVLVFALVTIVTQMAPSSSTGQQPEPPIVVPAAVPQATPPQSLQLPAIPPLPQSQPTLPPSLPTVVYPPFPTFQFKFDPKMSLKDLLPTQPQGRLGKLALLNDDLTKVPEITFGEHLSKELPRDKAIERTAYMVARVNHLNRNKTDGFMEALLDNRVDLRGLAFRMGDDCRMDGQHARLFSEIATVVQQWLASVRGNENSPEQVDQFWTQIHTQLVSNAMSPVKERRARCGQAAVDRAIVAALMQIVAPESERCRVGLAKFLGTINHLDAIHALAKLAIFAPEESVRTAAVDGLKLRRERDYTPILLAGFRYPLPSVAKNAAQALIQLDRKDLLPDLVGVLEQPDPRAPKQVDLAGQEVTVVRELVRVNHHKNCLMCHAPGNVADVPNGVLKVAIPLPGDTLVRATDAYYQTPPPSPDIVVRVDTTYLRQDFSMMMPVADAPPWPTMQRFDFLVRTRVLTEAERKECERQLADRQPGELPGAHRAALFALRELTGRDAEPTAQAWRRLLKL